MDERKCAIQTQYKKAGVAIFIPNKIKIKIITKDKEGHFIKKKVFPS